MIRSFVFLAAVLPLAAQVSPTINALPSRAFGHPKMVVSTINPNLVEGRELWAPSSVAIDATSSPPILYVADTLNNRILAWRNPLSLSKGNSATKVIGQRDFQSTFAQGPGRDLSTGVSTPVAVAVDRNGNLYVVDAGNNRVVRYPKPLEQTGELVTVDLVIGQRAVNVGTQPNQGMTDTQGNSVASAKTLAISSGNTAFSSGLAFDSQGNLWLSDPLNNRVLRYPVAQLAPNTTEPAADVVLGQFDFTSRQGPQPPNNIRTNKTNLVNPSGLAFDSTGRLYVVDGYSRCLQFTALTIGAQAARILGLPNRPTGQPPAAQPNSYELGMVTPQGQIQGAPEGVITFNEDVFILDTPNHRIVRYGPPGTWTPETTETPSPAAIAVIGQADLFQNKLHRGEKEPGDNTLSRPTAAAFHGTDLWVADTLNNRVLDFEHQGGLVYNRAARVLGQLDFPFQQPNLIEGRELFIGAGGLASSGGIVVDRSSSPPRLYIADSRNNRVLGFRDARVIKAGDRADLVIGQTDFFRALVNQPNSDALQPSDAGLFDPTGLAVDSAGNLLVADSGNGRVLRFPSPFAQPAGAVHRANLVLGQSSFTVKIQDASSSTMRTPTGLALFADGSLAVSDPSHNRVLVFRRPQGGDFQNGQAAAIVLGQTDFIGTLAGSQENRMSQPRHVASDTSDRLYVADTANSRMHVFTRASTAVNGATPAFTLTGLSQPTGVFVSSITGEIWIADTNASRARRFPEFSNLILNPQQNTELAISGPLAITLDAVDNPLILELTNRVSFYYPRLTFQNAANYSQRPLAPGMLAFLYRLGVPFDHPQASATTLPWPTDLSDVEVFVNGTHAPMFGIGGNRIDFQVPMNAPSSGTAEFLAQRKSTGEILAVADIQMAEVSPGFFTLNFQGTGQLAATNAVDNAVNGPSNGVARGEYVTLYGTGQGFVPNAPPDGMPPSGPAPTPDRPRVNINGRDVAEADIQYSGLGAFPGGWQINVKIPATAQPLANNLVAVTLKDVPSNRGPNNQTIQTTVYVK